MSGDKITSGKPSTHSWKSPINKFPKKMIPKDFFKKISWKRTGLVRRPRKARI
ncbi:hypothetical protein Hanom_Chr12g01106351 [Helianthus anomalus]